MVDLVVDSFGFLTQDDYTFAHNDICNNFTETKNGVLTLYYLLKIVSIQTVSREEKFQKFLESKEYSRSRDH